MATTNTAKPKSYPQKVQELQDQLQVTKDQLDEALMQNSFIQEMQDEISHLRGLVATQGKQDHQGTVSNKSQITDLTQRAESAEQGLRNAQLANKQLTQENQQLVHEIEAFDKVRSENTAMHVRLTNLSQEANDNAAQLARVIRLREDRINELVAENSNLARRAKEFAGGNQAMLDQVSEATQRHTDEKQQLLARIANKDLEIADLYAINENLRDGVARLSKALNAVKSALNGGA